MFVAIPTFGMIFDCPEAETARAKNVKDNNRFFILISCKIHVRRGQFIMIGLAVLLFYFPIKSQLTPKRFPASSANFS